MRHVAAILPLLAVLSASPMANAKDMAGRFGVGADTSLGLAVPGTQADGFPGASNPVLKLPGLSVVYRATKIFGIQLIFSTQITSGEQDLGVTQVPQTITHAGAALRGHIGVGFSRSANLDAVIGVSYVNQGHRVDGTSIYKASDFAIELGVRPEWFVHEHLSMHTQVGIVTSIVNQDVAGFTAGGVHINLFGAADLLGSAGFTFYF